MHLDVQFTQNIEIGAQRVFSQDSLEVVTQDSEFEVRNLRTSEEPRQWQIALPTIDVDGDTADFDSVMTMWGTSAQGTFRGLHTFNFRDFVDDAIYRVRFASSVQVTAAAGHLRHVDQFTVREALETSPEPTVDPAITGTQTVGSTLTCSTGTWSGSPTSYAYQWLRNGVEISSATASTHVLVSGDSGKMIGCSVTATDANGGETKTFAAEVGPIV
jgi:hypothetical protein